jgi:hypothetical protein
MLPSATLRSWLAALVPAVLLVAVAVWEIGATARARTEVPGDRAWREAAAAVREQFTDGELIVFAPRWVDPVGRLHLGDLIPVETAARLDDDRFGVVWELSIRGARAPETATLTPAWTATFDGVTVRRFERAPAVVVTDLVGLPVTAGPGASCGPDVVIAEVGFEPHRCVQVVPKPGQSVKLDYGLVELGGALVGAVGLADVFTRRDVRTPGQLELMIDAKIVATAKFGVDDGWVRFAADTTPGPHHVEVIATALTSKGRDRVICFAIEARR